MDHGCELARLVGIDFITSTKLRIKKTRIRRHGDRQPVSMQATAARGREALTLNTLGHEAVRAVSSRPSQGRCELEAILGYKTRLCFK